MSLLSVLLAVIFVFVANYEHDGDETKDLLLHRARAR